jgi:hypothetical protein
MVEDGWKSVGKVFMLALVLDVVYQLIQLRFVYPGEAIVVALVLAIVPYLILRGLVTRVARRRDAGGRLDSGPDLRREPPRRRAS